MNRIILFICALFLSGVFIACKKGPGEGGNSSIYGYISVTKYDQFFNTLVTYGGFDEDVYIIYGDDISFGDRIRSNHDGRFEFKYLREGMYKIYVYSEDTLPFGLLDTVPDRYPVIKNVEITGKNQHVDAGTFEIKKRVK